MPSQSRRIALNAMQPRSSTKICNTMYVVPLPLWGVRTLSRIHSAGRRAFGSAYHYLEARISNNNNNNNDDSKWPATATAIHSLSAEHPLDYQINPRIYRMCLTVCQTGTNLGHYQAQTHQHGSREWGLNGLELIYSYYHARWSEDFARWNEDLARWNGGLRGRGEQRVEGLGLTRGLSIVPRCGTHSLLIREGS